MSWLIFVAAAVLFDSARIYADNYSSDVYFKGRGAVSQKLFFTYALGLVGVGPSVRARRGGQCGKQG